MNPLPFEPSRFTLWCIYATLAVMLGSFASGCADNDPGISGGGGGTPGNGNGENGNGNGNGDATCDHPTGGDCDETTLVHCVDGVERKIECGDVFENGTCRRVALTAWCHVPTGGVCIVDDSGGDTRAHNARCGNTGEGCVNHGLDEPAICQPDLGTCTSNQVRSCLPGNQYYVYGCLAGQPRAYDCVAMGGRCTQDACRDLVEGSQCQTDLISGGRYMRCASHLDCVGETDLSKWGVCVPK